jgi:ATP adenylyltransferase
MILPSTTTAPLWERIVERTTLALRSGALQSLPTTHEWLEQGGVQFLVRILANIARKEHNRQVSKPDHDPFLPYEEDLFVADLSATHLCLLNKFNVVDHHLLIVTRSFEDQESPLNQQDFQAVWRCLNEYEGLAFYNSGAIAGASQRHKHLQLIPLPLAPEGPRIPIEPVLQTADFQDSLGMTRLPFKHIIARLDPHDFQSPQQAAAKTLALYQEMGRVLNLWRTDMNHIAPYNLLVTRNWMLLVPRTRECFDATPINALGFAGALLVKSTEQLNHLKACGPLTALAEVTL